MSCTAGVGLPEVTSWLGVNSSTAGVPSFCDTQRLPWASNVGITGSVIPVMVTAGVGLPEVASWLLVNSLTPAGP